MLIRDLFNQKKRTLSFEVFPPVREGNLESLFATIAELEELKPDFISVTYGAGGGTRDKTIEIASRVKNEIRSEALAHLTCVASSRDDIARILEDMKAQNIENILALRGDPPRGEERFVRPEGGFGFANELVEFIKAHGAFSIGVAGYPEGHPEAPSVEDDLKNLKRKVDAGADFIVTQLFFHNDDFYRFRDRCEAIGISVPIVPGILPVTALPQLRRVVAMCGANVPKALMERLETHPDNSQGQFDVGVYHAIRQVEDLVSRGSCRGVHFYCLNKSRSVATILRPLTLPNIEAFRGR